MDRLAIPTPFVAGCIRIGNLMNSEILGKPGDVPWSFVFDRIDRIPRHPAQLYESLSYFLLFVINMIYYRRNPNPRRGFLLGSFTSVVFRLAHRLGDLQRKSGSV